MARATSSDYPDTRSDSPTSNGLSYGLADTPHLARAADSEAMSPETFLEKFNLIADAPGAVAKMRELILELAIRGSLHSSGTSYTSDPSTPFAIPNDWQWLSLNEAADCRAASKVEASSLKDSDWVLDLEDIDGGAGKVITTATFAERRSLSTKASFQKVMSSTGSSVPT